MLFCSEKLDIILLKLLETVEEYNVLRNQLSSTMSSGFLHLAKAKQTVGPHLYMNIDNRPMVSSISVDFINNIYSLSPSQTVAIVKDEKQISDTTTVRKRTSNPDLSATFTTTFDQNVSKIVDPLTWFGILVPSDLRHAQVEFKQSLCLVMQLATHAHKMKLLQDEYDEIYKLVVPNQDS